MPGYFSQIVFSPKPKPEVVESDAQPESPAMDDLKIRAMFETVFCSKKDNWISMITCITCLEANRSLADIMEDNIGCIGE